MSMSFRQLLVLVVNRVFSCEPSEFLPGRYHDDRSAVEIENYSYCR